MEFGIWSLGLGLEGVLLKGVLCEMLRVLSGPEGVENMLTKESYEFAAGYEGDMPFCRTTRRVILLGVEIGFLYFEKPPNHPGIRTLKPKDLSNLDTAPHPRAL